MGENNWMEIISVRLFDSGQRRAVRDIFNQVNSDTIPNPDHALNVELYVNNNNETDWSIYLYWKRQNGDSSKTVMGLSIAEAFSNLGLVHHSVWAKDIMRKEIDHERK
jgi:hypothetical protein